MTTDQRLSEISKQLEVLPALAAEIEALKKQNTEILAQLAKAPVTPPVTPPVEKSLFDLVGLDDPLVEYTQLGPEAGLAAGKWVSPPYASFPGNEVAFPAFWTGNSCVGPVLHGGDAGNMEAARIEAYRLNELDKAGRYVKTEWAVQNIPPVVAASLLTLRLVAVDYASGFNSNSDRAPSKFANVTSLEALFNLLQAREAGGGTFSGGKQAE